jgi:hypothetical protein
MGGFGTSPLELLAADAMLRGKIYLNSAVYPFKWLTGQASALGSGGTVPVVVNINGDSDFLCLGVTGIAFSTNSTTEVADPNIEALFEIASGRMWFNQSLNFRTFIGGYNTGLVPNQMFMPRLIPAQSTITITLTDNQATAWNRVEIALIGANVYYQSATRDQVFHVL